MAQAWYMYPDDTGTGQYGSYPDPMGAYTKPDDNVCVPSIVPITAIMSGTVTDISWNKAWSGSVTVKLDHPPNSFAQYCAYNFLTVVNCQVGQRLQVGSLVGYPGKSVCLAFGLTNATPWGAGYFGKGPGSADPRLDPRPIIQAARAGRFDTSTVTPNPLNALSSFFTGTTSPVQAFVSVSDAAHNTLNAIPGMIGIVEALDIAEQFQPFTLPNDPTNSIIGKIPIIGGALQDITLPADSMQAFLTFITANTMAFVIRAIIVFIGVMILVALIRNALNTTTVEMTGQTPGQLAGSALKIGAAAAAL